MNAQAEQMRAFVGELIALVSGSALLISICCSSAAAPVTMWRSRQAPWCTTSDRPWM